MVSRIAPAIIIAAVVLNAIGDDALPPLGMWSWSRNAFATPAARKEMLDFCKREGITHIDQHVTVKNGIVLDAEALKQLIVEAAEQGVSVNALRGERNMFFEALRERTLNELKTIIAFDKQLPDTAKLAGIKYDVEPYLTPEWKAGGKPRRKVILDYLASLKAAKKLRDKDAAHLKLSVDVPFWWDKAEYIVAFDGETKCFVHHIQDLTDWIGIMSYRREVRLVLKFVEGELAYAKKMKRPKSVAPGLETIEIKGNERSITFWGSPSSSFRTALTSIRKKLSQSPGVRCIMLHDYRSLVKYLATEK